METGRMKKLMTLCIAMAVLCGACISGDSAAYTQSAAPGRDQGSGLLEAAAIAVERGDDAFMGGADFFGARLRGLVAGAGTMEVRATGDPLADLQSGQASFAFLRAQRYQEDNPEFAALCAPFLYRDYRHFTMSTNNEEVIAGVNNSVGRTRGFVVLGSFYQGSRHLLASWYLTDLKLTEVPVVTDSATATGSMLRLMGADIVQEADSGARLQYILDGEADVGEFTLAELQGLDLSRAPKYLNLTYHTASPVLLVADREFYLALSNTERAAVQEATAYLFAQLDAPLLEREAEYIEDIELMGVEVKEEFTDAHNQVYQVWKSSTKPGTGESYLLGLLENIA